ncbi:hypothetical protein ACWGCP_20285, partial [Streptomyces niveus]
MGGARLRGHRRGAARTAVARGRVGTGARRADGPLAAADAGSAVPQLPRRVPPVGRLGTAGGQSTV